MPKVVYQAAQIKDADWEVRAAIATIAALNSEATPEAIARFTGMGKKAIASSLKRLEEVGLIFRSSARRSAGSRRGSNPTSTVASTSTKCPEVRENPPFPKHSK